MNVRRMAAGRVGRWTTGALLCAALTMAASACGVDSNDDAAGGRGAAIYGANCASCHGASLEGTDRGPLLLEAEYESDRLSDAELLSAVRNGVPETLWDFGPMPALGGLGDAQITQVIAYIRAAQGSTTAP